MEHPTQEERLHTMYVVIARSMHMFMNADVAYPEEEFASFARANGYEMYYNTWASCGYRPLELPVTARLNDKLPWDLNNIIIVSMAENMDDNFMSDIRLAEKTTRVESSHGQRKDID